MSTQTVVTRRRSMQVRLVQQQPSPVSREYNQPAALKRTGGDTWNHTAAAMVGFSDRHEPDTHLSGRLNREVLVPVSILADITGSGRLALSLCFAGSGVASNTANMC